jgi:hypothetical protein
MTEYTTIYLEKTKKGLPALWEEGGGMSNTGNARVICDSEGYRKKPVYIRTGGHLALSNHALFVLREGDIVVDVQRHHDDFDISVKQIRKIKTDAEGRLVAEAETLAHFDQGEWDNEDIASKYQDAITSAREKSRCYHCREPHYFTNNPEFRRKITVNLKDIQSLQALCNILGYKLDCKRIDEDRFFFDFDDKQRKIAFWFNEDTMDVETNMTIRYLENAGVLEIDRIDNKTTAIVRIRGD